MATAVVVRWEVRVYLRQIEMVLSNMEVTALVATLFGKSLLFYSIPTIVAHSIIRVRPRMGWTMFAVGTSVVSAAVAVNLRVYSGTGSDLRHFLALAIVTNAAEWAGGTSSVVRGIGPLILMSMVGTICLVGGCWATAMVLSQRWGALVRGLGMRWSGPAFATLAVCACPLAMSALNDRTLAHLVREMAVVPIVLRDVKPDPTWEPFANALAERVTPDVHVAAETKAGDVTARVRKGPHVLLIVCESLRGDMMNPEVMPRLDRLVTSHGIRFTRHSAGATASHLGMFGLLYGRYSLRYFDTLDAGVPPQLNVTLKRSGYRATYRSAMEHRGWLDMEKFVAEPAFDQVLVRPAATRVEDRAGGDGEYSWPAGDRQCLADLVEIAHRSDPQFAVTFLASTHYPYRYPAEDAVFLPVPHESQLFAPEPSEYREFKNRYKNAAHYLDRVIADLVERVDLTRTIVVVTGDHGESFGEDKMFGHMNGRTSVEQSRVPLLLFGPVQPRTVDTATCHADLAPTLLRLIDADADFPSGLDGVDVLQSGFTCDSSLITRTPNRNGTGGTFDVSTGNEGIVLSLSGQTPQLVVGGRTDRSGGEMAIPFAPDAPEDWSRRVAYHLKRMRD